MAREVRAVQFMRISIDSRLVPSSSSERTRLIIICQQSPLISLNSGKAVARGDLCVCVFFQKTTKKIRWFDRFFFRSSHHLIAPSLSNV